MRNMQVKFKVNIASTETEKRFLNGKTIRDLPAIPAYLVNFAAGRAATNPSPWGDNIGIYDSDIAKNKASGFIRTFTRTPRLREYEITRIDEKFGPQGWIYPLGSNEMIDKINLYYTACHNPCKVDPKVVSIAVAALDGADLTPYSPQQTIQRALEKTGLTSNSGTPLFTKRAKVIAPTLNLLETVVAYQASGVPVDYYPASIIGARSIKQKMRLIFMAPFSQNVVELGYVYAIMDWLLNNSDIVEGWRGQPAVEYAMQPQFVNNVTHISTDFTAMDTSVGPAQIRMFAEVFRHLFKKQYQDGFRNALIRTPEAPVLCGVLKSPGRANVSRNRDSLVYLSGTHGLFSGLGWTNCVETGLSWLLDIAFSQYYDTLGVQINGDDGEKTIDGRKSLTKVAETFASLARNFGFACNPSKQLVSYDEIRYLQRVYSPETVENGFTRGAYPFALTLNSIKNPERSAYLSDWQQAERVLNISNNLMGHPYKFEALTKIVTGSPAIIEWLETGAGIDEMSAAYQSSMSTGQLEGSNFGPDDDKFEDVEVVRYLQTHSADILSSLGW